MIPTYYTAIRILLTVLFCLATIVTLADTLTTSVDRNQLGKGETLELLVQLDRQTTSDPDFTPLNDDFEVLSRQQKNKYSLMNGNSTSYTEWRLQLLPKKTGKLQIPSLSFKGVVSTPITLQVEDRPQTSTTTGNQPVFVETDVDKSSAYVQEQLLITFRINASTNLQSISSEELMIKDASVIKVSENQYQKQINGINHLVIELQYAIFPESSGNLAIPAIRFNTVIPDRRDPYSNSFFSRGGKRLFLYSEEKKITIKPRPTSYVSTEWLPTTAVSLSERWSGPLDELVAGEPITRTIYLSAQGLTSAQLPPLDINAGDGFKIYPDQPQLNDDVSSNGVMGTREESIAIVPSRGGTITLSPITVQWWDTASNQMRETVLDGQTLTIKPPENAISAAVSAAVIPSTAETPLTEKQQPSLVFWLLIIGNTLLLGTTIIFLVLWRGARNKTLSEPTPSEESPERKEAALFKQLQRQAKNKDPRAFREGLLTWASVRWQHPLVTLDDVAVTTKDPILTTELRALDQSLYSPEVSTVIDLGPLLDHLKNLRKQPMGEKVPKGNHLQALYGES
jgi:hypothetical protein